MLRTFHWWPAHMSSSVNMPSYVRIFSNSGSESSATICKHVSRFHLSPYCTPGRKSCRTTDRKNIRNNTTYRKERKKEITHEPWRSDNTQYAIEGQHLFAMPQCGQPHWRIRRANLNCGARPKRMRCCCIKLCALTPIPPMQLMRAPRQKNADGDSRQSGTRRPTGADDDPARSTSSDSDCGCRKPMQKKSEQTETKVPTNWHPLRQSWR